MIGYLRVTPRSRRIRDVLYSLGFTFNASETIGNVSIAGTYHYHFIAQAYFLAFSFWTINTIIETDTHNNTKYTY